MAKDVLLKEDGRGKRTSLHGAALNAPRYVNDCMLAWAPDAARVKTHGVTCHFTLLLDEMPSLRPMKIVTTSWMKPLRTVAVVTF